MTYQRPQFQILAKRLIEPRRFIQVVAGPRQVGKTTLVQQVCESVGLPVQFASADEPTLRGQEWIAQQWEIARLKLDKRSGILVLDEVQKIDGWSETVKRLWDEDKRKKVALKVVLLGSAPLLIQRGLSESLAGRFEVLHLPHWSAAEMREAFGWSVEQAIFYGGYPGAASLIEDHDRWVRYVRDALIETTLSRDVLLMSRVDKPALLRRMFELGLPLFRTDSFLHQDDRPATGCREYDNVCALSGVAERGGHVDRVAQIYGRGSAQPEFQPQAASARYGIILGDGRLSF
jgi:predicted AAA+ superfamily ATPase